MFHPYLNYIVNVFLNLHLFNDFRHFDIFLEFGIEFITIESEHWLEFLSTGSGYLLSTGSKFFEPWLVLTLAFFCPCFLRFSFFCLLFGTWNRKIISFYGTICWISHIPRHASSACVFSKWLKCCTYCCTVCIFLLNPAHSSALAIFCVQTWCAVSMLAAFWMMKCTADTCTALLRFLDCF